MGFLKFLVWTGCAVGLGVFLATVDLEGRSPLEYAQRQWNRHVRPAQVERQVERVKDELRDAVDEAKDTVDEAKDTVKRTTKQAAVPRERITHEDRAAIDRIIAQKK